MNTTYGIEKPAAHVHEDDQPPVRFVVLIDAAGAGARVARLFLATREQVAEFEAASPEVLMMTRDLAAAHDGADAVWDQALAGHSLAERQGAQIYTLDV